VQAGHRPLKSKKEAQEQQKEELNNQQTLDKGIKHSRPDTS
jgi:hypothetical protein